MAGFAPEHPRAQRLRRGLGSTENPSNGGGGLEKGYLSRGAAGGRGGELRFGGRSSIPRVGSLIEFPPGMTRERNCGEGEPGRIAPAVEISISIHHPTREEIEAR